MDKRLYLLAVATFAIGTDNYVVAGILPQVARAFGVSIATAGQFVTVYALAYGVLTPVAAALTAHWPRRRVLAWGLALFIGSNALTATAPTFGLALAGRALAGLGGAMVSPAAGAAAAALVTPERRGRALAIVLAGLSGATALGAPLGTLVASFGDWRITLWFVAAIAVGAWLGIAALFPVIAAPSALRLRERLAPLGDGRVLMTLTATAVAMFGVFLVYTYASVVFDRATGGRGEALAALMAVWGIGATVGSLRAGSLSDRFGNRRVINGALAIAAIDFALMPWSGAQFATALVAVGVWGLCGWGFVVSQQHRLVGIAPALAPVLLALNASSIYLAVSASAAAGALATRLVDPHALPLASALLILSAVAAAELAHRRIRIPAAHAGDAPDSFAGRARP